MRKTLHRALGRGPRRQWSRLAAGIAVAVAVAGCGNVSADNSSSGGSKAGVTDDEIIVGGTYALSGPNSALGVFGPVSKAVFDSVNAEGGINGRKIKFVYYDDAGNPSRVLENARRLVEQDKVACIYATVGTTVSSSILDYVGQQKVPQVFALGGSLEFGKVDEHPWTTTMYAANHLEGAAHGKFVLEKNPDAKIAVLATHDDAGSSYVYGLKQAIEGSGATIVDEESYEFTDVSLDSQIAKMKASGADTLLIIALAKYASLALKQAADTGWHPMTMVTTSASSREVVLKPAGLENVQGIYSAFFFKDPADPQWAEDPAMQRYREVLATYGGNLDPNSSLNLNAYMTAMAFVEMLRGVKDPTRESINEAAHNFSAETVPGLLPGIPVHLEQGDPWAIETLQYVQFEGEQWRLLGEDVDLEGQTPR